MSKTKSADPQNSGGNNPGPLGWIEPKDRTKEQHEAHEIALAKMPKFMIIGDTVAKPLDAKLWKFWYHPDVVADTGVTFTRFHQLTGSCFPRATPIRMHDGSEKPIEEIRVGDEVLTHHDRRRRVAAVMTRQYTGEMVTLHVAAYPFPLRMTADHHVAVMPSRCDWRWQPGTVEWKRADEIERDDRVLIAYAPEHESDVVLDTLPLLGDDGMSLDELMKDNAYTKGQEADTPHANLGSARQQVRRSGIDWHGRVRIWKSKIENSIFRHVPLCASLARFIGIYLAEGGCDAGRVVFTFSVKERETLAAETLALARGLFGIEGEIIYQEGRPNTCKVRFNNLNLATVLKSLIPGNVYTKRVPPIFMSARNEVRLALLGGWLSGDGYAVVKDKTELRIQGVTASPDLARDMLTLAITCGMKASAYQRQARGRSRVAYDVLFSGPKVKTLYPTLYAAAKDAGSRLQTTDTNETRHGYARRVTKIERDPVEMLDVFDFEVEDDHSFVAGGLVVHNCVGVGAGDMLYTLGAIQRVVSDTPTKAFIPWWPFPYGKSRLRAGMRSPGEGSLGATMAEALVKDGVFDARDPKLPKFKDGGDDGFTLTSSIERQWSDGDSSTVSPWDELAANHLCGVAAPCETVEDLKNGIVNGYPGTIAYGRFVGHGSVKGSGDNKCVVGRFDSRGGHQTSIVGYWDHPELGPLFLNLNQWPAQTYPRDPSGAPPCSVWQPADDIASALRSRDMELFVFSNFDYFPAQPRVIRWLIQP